MSDTSAYIPLWIIMRECTARIDSTYIKISYFSSVFYLLWLTKISYLHIKYTNSIFKNADMHLTPCANSFIIISTLFRVSFKVLSIANIYFSFFLPFTCFNGYTKAKCHQENRIHKSAKYFSSGPTKCIFWPFFWRHLLEQKKKRKKN